MESKYRIATVTQDQIFSVLNVQETQGYILVAVTLDPMLSTQNKVATFHCFFRSDQLVKLTHKMPPMKEC